MKKYIYNIHYVLLMLVLIVNSACETNLIEEQELPYLFRPVNIEVDASTTDVVITWSDLEESNSYKVEIFQDSLEFVNLFKTETVIEKMYTSTLEGDKLYSLRIKSISNLSGKESKFVENVTFRTPKENLFLGYEPRMIGQGKAEITWLSNSEVTQIILHPSDEVISSIEVPVSDEEKQAGYLTVDELENDNYTIEIKNGSVIRGNTSVVVEGDVFLNTGDDLVSAISGAADGAIIVLEDNSMFPITSIINLDRSIKVRSIVPEKAAVIYPSVGAGLSRLFGIGTDITVDNVEFENIIITGSEGNDEANSQILYNLYIVGGAATINNLSFTNCTIKNFYRTGVYMSTGSGDHIINDLSFNECIIQNNGYGSTLAFLSFYKEGDDIHNITFKDCTISKLQNNLIYGAYSEIESITLENCTLNEIVMNDSSSRLFLDFVSTTAIGEGNIRIANCIFGATQFGLTKGLRAGDELTTEIQGSYATADYDDTSVASNSIIDLLQEYTGNSTSLWVDPENGDFSFQDNNFDGKLTAGDPRWRE